MMFPYSFFSQNNSIISLITMTSGGYVAINDGNNPPTSGNPYPSTITVSNGVGGISDLRLYINGLSHTNADDVQMVLESPAGQILRVIGNCGGNNAVSNINLTFNKTGTLLPDNTAFTNGIYRDSFHSGEPFPSFMPIPCPDENIESLSGFDGYNPNGTWKLWIADDAVNGSGSIASWGLDISLTGAVNPVYPQIGYGSYIHITDLGKAIPYPSTLTVSNFTGSITKVKILLNRFSHTYPDDVDMMLVSPQGQAFVFMSDCGGGHGVLNAGLVLDQDAAEALPDEDPIEHVFRISSNKLGAIYRPANYYDGNPDSFSSPAPSANIYSLTGFNGYSPNGEWKLFIIDDAGGDNGQIGNWTLSITTT